MPGRTENNVKNRFNMMFKNIKDEYIKNRGESRLVRSGLRIMLGKW